MYRVIINSINSNDINLLTTNTTKSKFFINWSRMIPEGKYELSFTYASQQTQTILSNNNALLKLNFINYSSYDLDKTSFILGNLNVKGKSDLDNNSNTLLTYLDASLTDNKPIILERPNDGELIIEIVNKDNNYWSDDLTVYNGAAVVQTGAIPTTQAILRNLITRARFIIGSQIIYNTGNYIYCKIRDYLTGYGLSQYGDGTYSIYTPNSAFPTSGLSVRTGGTVNQSGVTYDLGRGNPPAHYILILNFKKI